jgi:hypothetical protein
MCVQTARRSEHCPTRTNGMRGALERCKPCTSRQLAPCAVSLAALPHARNRPQWLPAAVADHALRHLAGGKMSSSQGLRG